MSAGTHVFTLFDENNKPIAERLFFNFDGISSLKSEIVNTKKFGLDSVEVKLNYTNYQSSEFNNVSISILPFNTTSYFKNNNILSQTFLQPFIKSKIENAGYYFTDISDQKKYDLDNLLLTQGWSSYNWDNLFDKEIIIKTDLKAELI
ncbi:MAG: hypothetical protein HC798_01555 [Polaribacter sp.]|nr:hypothetical protein [Polaribacter sp.]